MGRILLLSMSIALAFWVGRRSMWEYELLARNPRGVTLDMLSMGVPATFLGLPIDGWVVVAFSMTLGALAICRPRANEMPTSADGENRSSMLKPGRCILMALAIALTFWSGHASMWEYKLLSQCPSGFTLDMLADDLPEKHLGLTIACWVMLAISATLGALATRRLPALTSSPHDKDDHAQIRG